MFPSTVSFLIHLLLHPANAGALPVVQLDPAHPPTPLDAEGSRKPSNPAAFRFPMGQKLVTFTVLPAVVVHMRTPDARPAVGRHLGGRSWRIEAPTADAAIRLSFDLLQQPDVDTAFPDVLLPTQRWTNDPHRDGQWYLDDLEMDSLHAVTYGDPSVRVAVIDSGIEWQHPDLIDRVLAPYDAFDDDDDPSPNPGEYCAGASSAICDEHGTAVSGVVAATVDNGVGIVGMCPACTLVPIKMLGESGGTLSADVAAFEHAIAQDVAVINNSWGFTSRVPVPVSLAAVIDRAATEPRDGKGAVVVFAAGNDNRELGDEELTALDGVVCVSATDVYGYPTSYTNYGASVDVAAPSATVSITPIDDFTMNFGGTSAAAPVVSGLAAWILSYAPSLTAAEVATLLTTTAAPSPYVTHDASGHHDTYGYGVVDPPAVLAALSPDVPENDDTAAEVDDDTTPSSDEASKGGCSVTERRTSRLPAMALILAALVGAFPRRRLQNKDQQCPTR